MIGEEQRVQMVSWNFNVKIKHADIWKVRTVGGRNKRLSFAFWDFQIRNKKENAFVPGEMWSMG